MQKNRYQLRCAAGKYWLLDMEQDGETYRPPRMFNESGAYIFRQYMAGNTADKIAEELATMYGGIADDMRTDVMQFIRQMELQGIL